jgi:hypothetical protein
MFDIKDYFEERDIISPLRNDILTIDDDITHDIINLLSNRFDSLYLRDRYKHSAGAIEIIYPRLKYPGSNQLLMNPDRIRNLLSFYPEKGDLGHVDKIVMRPRFIEIGSIELVSLFLRRKRIIVLYLFHPHFYRMRFVKPGECGENTIDLDTIIAGGLIDDSVRRQENSDICVHPLWYFLSTIGDGDDDSIDKFFIKKDSINDKIYEILNDISFYYSRHGY